MCISDDLSCYLYYDMKDRFAIRFIFPLCWYLRFGILFCVLRLWALAAWASACRLITTFCCSQGGVPPPGFWSATEPGLRSSRLLTGASVDPWALCQSRTCWRLMRGQPYNILHLTITPTPNPPQNSTPNPPHSITSTPIPICTPFTLSKKAGPLNWTGGLYPSTVGTRALLRLGRPGLLLWTWLALTQRHSVLGLWRMHGGAAVP